MRGFQRAKQIIESADPIAILASAKFSKESFPSVLALFYSLKKLGKNVNLIAEDYPEQYHFLVQKDNFQPTEADFLISIKEAGAKLHQLFYEKTDQGLNLFLKTDGGQLKKENVSLLPLVKPELVITIGNNGFRLKTNFIINIQEQADLETIIAHLYGMANNGPVRIFERVLRKINIVEGQGLGCILLQKRDFALTKSSPADLRFSLDNLSAGLFPFENFLCLWEQKHSPFVIQGVFYSPNKVLRKKVLTSFGGEQKGQGVLFQAEETELQNVKDRILEIINL